MKRSLIVCAASIIVLVSCNSNKDTYNENTSESTVSSDNTTSTDNSSPTTYTQNNPVNVPDNIRNAFTTQYPTASDVTWSPYKQYDRINWEWTGWPSMDTSYYAVNYTVDNRKHMSWWDKLGKWIGSTSTIEDSTKLPDPVKKTLKNSYAGYKIKDIDEETDNKRTVYEIKLEKGDATARILVDKNGRILKKDTKA